MWDSLPPVVVPAVPVEQLPGVAVATHHVGIFGEESATRASWPNSVSSLAVPPPVLPTPQLSLEECGRRSRETLSALPVQQRRCRVFTAGHLPPQDASTTPPSDSTSQSPYSLPDFTRDLNSQSMSASSPIAAMASSSPLVDINHPTSSSNTTAAAPRLQYARYNNFISGESLSPLAALHPAHIDFPDAPIRMQQQQQQYLASPSYSPPFASSTNSESVALSHHRSPPPLHVAESPVEAVSDPLEVLQASTARHRRWCGTPGSAPRCTASGGYLTTVPSSCLASGGTIHGPSQGSSSTPPGEGVASSGTALSVSLPLAPAPPPLLTDFQASFSHNQSFYRGTSGGDYLLRSFYFPHESSGLPSAEDAYVAGAHTSLFNGSVVGHPAHAIHSTTGDVFFSPTLMTAQHYPFGWNSISHRASGVSASGRPAVSSSNSASSMVAWPTFNTSLSVTSRGGGAASSQPLPPLPSSSNLSYVSAGHLPAQSTCSFPSPSVEQLLSPALMNQPAGAGCAANGSVTSMVSATAYQQPTDSATSLTLPAPAAVSDVAVRVIATDPQPQTLLSPEGSSISGCLNATRPFSTPNPDSLVEATTSSKKTSHPPLDDVEWDGALLAFQDRAERYYSYKNSCTETYLSLIEVDVDSFLTKYFSGGSPQLEEDLQSTTASIRAGGIGCIAGQQGSLQRIFNTNKALKKISATGSKWLTKVSMNLGRGGAVDDGLALPPTSDRTGASEGVAGLMPGERDASSQPSDQEVAALEELTALRSLGQYQNGVIADTYMDVMPSSAALRQVQRNYPILRFALEYVVPSEDEDLNEWPHSRRTTDSSTSATPARVPASGTGTLKSSTRAFIHERLRLWLLIPVVQTIWKHYLYPLETKVKELTEIAKHTIDPILEALTERQKNQPSGATLLLKQERVVSVRRLVTLLKGDYEYLTTIHAMDNEFVEGGAKWKKRCAGMRGPGVALSDYVPVYGLVLSRLHRLEMEHRTVMELWCHKRAVEKR